MAEPLLAVTGLVAGYGMVTVLRGVDLAVHDGEVVAVLGSNGVGKTTLNNNISAIHRPFAGRIRFGGVDITGAASERVVAAGLVQVPEGRNIFQNLSVRENLELGSYRRRRAHRAGHLARVLAILP